MVVPKKKYVWVNPINNTIISFFAKCFINYYLCSQLKILPNDSYRKMTAVPEVMW